MSVIMLLKPYCLNKKINRKKDHVKGIASRRLKAHDKNNLNIKNEALAILFAVKKYRLSIWNNYLYINSSASKFSQILHKFDIKIQKRNGKANMNVDVLSGMPQENKNENEKDEGLEHVTLTIIQHFNQEDQLKDNQSQEILTILRGGNHK